MLQPGVALRRAVTGDIPFIVETEQTPGYEQYVGRWSDERHRTAMASPSFAYLLGTVDGAVAAFAILQDLDERHGSVLIRRVAAARPGRGFGSRFLAGVIDWTFRVTAAHRLWLNVVDDNDRACHVYRALGFVEEGRKREAFLKPDGRRRDMVMMSILRREWRERPLPVVGG